MQEVLLIGLVTLISAIIGTVGGFGISSIMVPILVLFYPQSETLLFVGIIHLFGDIWKILFFKKGLHLKLLLLFAIPGIFATFVGASLIIEFSSEIWLRILGLALMVYGLFLEFSHRWELKEDSATAILGGAFSGFLAGAFGIGGAVRSAFLSAFNLKPEVYIFTIGLIALTVDSTRIITYYNEGVRFETFPTSALLISVPITMVGAIIAKNITHLIPHKYFRKFVAALLILIGIKLVIFP